MNAQIPGLRFEGCGEGKFRITSEPDDPDTTALACGCLLAALFGVMGLVFTGVTLTVFLRGSEVPSREIPSFIGFLLFLGTLSATFLFVPLGYLWNATNGKYPRVFEIDVQQRILTLKRAGKKDRIFPFSDLSSVQLLTDQSSLQRHCLSFLVRGIYGNVEIHWAAQSPNEQSIAQLSDAGNAIATAINIPFMVRKGGVRVWHNVSGI